MTEEQSDIITMADMAAVFDVTDALSIDRELIRVELTKEDPGAIAARHRTARSRSPCR